MSLNQFNNPAINPMGMGFNNQQNPMSNINFLPHYEVIQVNGANGVDAFQMGPNSSALLLDKTAPIVWLVQTDGAGYKVKTPYDLNPHQEAAQPDFNSLETRITKLEELVNAKLQPNSRTTKSRKPKADSEQSTDESN